MLNSLQLAIVPSLHDAELYLVQMDRENGTLELGFKGVNPVRIDPENGQIEPGFKGINQSFFTISFTKIYTYRLNDVIDQNVVSRILIENTQYGLGNELEKMVRWTSSAGNNLLIPEKTLADIIKKITSGELIFFYVDPSWGAEIGVIAEGMKISREASEPN